jgi:hypothetical protein
VEAAEPRVLRCSQAPRRAPDRWAEHTLSAVVRSAEGGAEHPAEGVGHQGGHRADGQLAQFPAHQRVAGQHPTVAPVANKAAPTRTAAVGMAVRPSVTKNGRSGMTAPLAKALRHLRSTRVGATVAVAALRVPAKPPLLRRQGASSVQNSCPQSTSHNHRWRGFCISCALDGCCVLARLHRTVGCIAAARARDVVGDRASAVGWKESVSLDVKRAFPLRVYGRR